MNDMRPLSDAAHHDGRSIRLTVGCYLIRHGEDYLLWDAGLPTAYLGSAEDDSSSPQPMLMEVLRPQLARIGVKPKQIRWLALSHYHFDHAGQAAQFPDATLLMGARDWQALQHDTAPFGADKSLLAPWLEGSGAVEPVEGDHDLFGDGSVVLLAMPGHTPGSLALLVRLAETGPVILSGDVIHLERQMRDRIVPSWNVQRADSLASMERLEQLARNLGARIVVQHDPAHVDRLAPFPASSR